MERIVTAKASSTPGDFSEGVMESPRSRSATFMQRTFDWLKSWGMLEGTASPVDLVDLDVQREAHAAV